MPEEVVRVPDRRNIASLPLGTTPSRWAPPRPPDPQVEARRTTRRVALAGVLGTLPGFVLVLIPIVLHEMGVISSDQSQIAFSGLPLMIVGAIASTAAIGSNAGVGAVALAGGFGGFAVGLTVGLAVGGVLRAVGTGVVGTWLLLTPIGIVVGATLAVSLRLRHDPPRAA